MSSICCIAYYNIYEKHNNFPFHVKWELWDLLSLLRGRHSCWQEEKLKLFHNHLEKDWTNCKKANRISSCRSHRHRQWGCLIMSKEKKKNYKAIRNWKFSSSEKLTCATLKGSRWRAQTEYGHEILTTDDTASVKVTLQDKWL